jgi:presenilin-like A22 family membrane protease
MAEETRVEHPNRDKPGAKAARAIIVMLLIATAVLIAIITIGGWKVLQGAQPLAFVYVLLYAVMAFYVARWSRGLLPVAAGLSILLAVIAAVSAPGWFARDKTGFRTPAIDANMLGLLTIILIPVSLLLVAFAMRGFAQKWNVEVERRHDEYDGYDGYDDPYDSGDRGDTGPQPAGA